MVEDAVVNGSSIVFWAFMYDSELAWGKWYRSKEKKGGDHPFTSYMLNKKWTLEEEFNNHMLRFQQVKCSLLISPNFIFTFHSRLD